MLHVKRRNEMISLVLMKKTQLCDIYHILFVKYCIGFPQTQEYNCSGVANLSNFIVTFYANNNFYAMYDPPGRRKRLWNVQGKTVCIRYPLLVVLA